MAKAGKRYRAAAARVDRARRYPLSEAFELVPQLRISEKYGRVIGVEGTAFPVTQIHFKKPGEKLIIVVPKE